MTVFAVLSNTSRPMAQHMPRAPEAGEPNPMPGEGKGDSFNLSWGWLIWVYKAGEFVYEQAKNCRDGGDCEEKVNEFPLVIENGKKVSHLPVDWNVGDCVLKSGATIEFDRNGTVHFRASGHTTGTLSGDVWHQHFKVKDADGRVVYQNQQQFRVPDHDDLHECNRPGTCADLADETQNYDAGTFDALGTIIWEAGC